MIGRQIEYADALPTSWKISPVGEIGTYLNGFAFKPEHWGTDGLPIIRIQNLNDSRKPFNYFNGKVAEKYRIQNGDVLVSWSASLGTFRWNRGDAWLNQHIFKATPNLEAVSDEYFYWVMVHAIDRIAGNARGSTMKHVTAKEFKNSEVAVPPLSEQKQIAHILSIVQRAIELQERIIQTTIELKNALMQKLFTEGLRDEPQKQTEIGPIPESWEVVDLGAVINLFAGYAFKSKEGVPESHTQLLRMGNLYQNSLDLSRNPIFYPDAFAEEHKRFVLAEGDLVMSLTGTSGKEDYGFTVKLPKTEKTLLLNQRIARIDITDDQLQKDFAHHFLLSRKFLDFLYPTAKGMKQANLSTNAMKKLLFVLPDKQEQTDIADCFQSLERKIDIARRKAKTLQDLFRALLHILMTAKTRVHELHLPEPKVYT